MQSKISLFLILILFYSIVFSQTTVNGVVNDNKGNPLFGASLYLKSQPSNGTSSDNDGNFKLTINNLNDTLVVSFITHRTKLINLSKIKTNETLHIILSENKQALNEVIIVGKDPISERFSVKKVNKLDIYFNPISKGDPLNFILILPASTNTNETANPTLRGGAADRSRVYLNGSPIINPVRNAQDNGLGNFSLLNTEIIDKQYVYASNPPLTYGNSSAGIVEVETSKKLSVENIQVSLALSNLGVMVNKNIGKKSFFQFYTNNQFSNLLINLNSKKLPDLNSFSSQDAGLNFRSEINNTFSINSFSYYIHENYDAYNSYLNYKGISQAMQKRFFTINSFDYNKKKSHISLSTLFDTSDKKYTFGIIDSKSHYNNFFVALSHKYKFNNRLTLQYGFNFYDVHYNYNEIRPQYFFSINNDSPFIYNNESFSFNYSELYLYADYKLNNVLGFSSALRKNLFIENKIKQYTSYQFSGFYNINKKNRFILGLGNYYSYSTPNYYHHDISLLNSKQISLDYYYTKRKFNITSAFYYKTDKGNLNNNYVENFDKIKTLGFEMSFNYNLNKYLSFGLSNTFVEQNGYLNQNKYNTSNNLNYYIKSQLTYNNPKYFTTSLLLINRPGNNYTGITDSFFNPSANNYQPFFGTFNNKTFSDYFKIDFTINKVFNINNNPLIVFVSLNNVLNNKNKSNIYYNDNYSKYFYDYYQQRIIYLGLQFRLNHIFNHS